MEEPITFVIKYTGTDSEIPLFWNEDVGGWGTLKDATVYSLLALAENSIQVDGVWQKFSGGSVK